MVQCPDGSDDKCEQNDNSFLSFCPEVQSI